MNNCLFNALHQTQNEKIPTRNQDIIQQRRSQNMAKVSNKETDVDPEMPAEGDEQGQ